MKKIIVSVLKFLLPRSIRKNILFFIRWIKNKIIYNKKRKHLILHYSEVENRIKKNSSILRFASYVVYDSSFAAYGLMDLLLNDSEKYSAKIVIIPDVSRGENHMREQYIKSKNFFENRYGQENVLDGWNEDTNEFLDLSQEFDIVYVASPYNQMVSKVHSVSYLSEQQVLPVYLSYGCMPDNYGCKVIMPSVEISLFWKVFADNKFSYEDFRRYELCHGKNVVLSGYAKMDNLSKAKITEHVRKRIVIAPHHSINNNELPLSNFLEYKDFFLELPKIYPQIDFIFRPHPLLFTNMVNEGYWTEEEKKLYIQAIIDSGMEYSISGDYLEIFANSDALIHDCSSFVVEYLYTKKPCCFIPRKNYKSVFSTLGKSCLENYYLAFSKQEVCNFITDVVLNSQDVLKEQREHYAGDNLMLNYPDVSSVILKEIDILRQI